MECTSITGREEVTNPLLKPLGSMMIFVSTIGPAFENSSFKSSPVTSKNRFPTYTLLDVVSGASEAPNPVASPRLCAAPVTAAPAVCTADLNEPAAAEACSADFSEVYSALDAVSPSSAFSAEVAIELSPCWASVAPSASGSDCVTASSA